MWLNDLQAGLSTADSSLLALTCQLAPWRQQMDGLSSLLQRLTVGSRHSSTSVDSAGLLTELYDAYSAHSRLDDENLTALLLCLLLDVLEPYLDTLEQVALTIT